MYDLEEGKIISRINEKGYKKVLLQLPDGLKPRAGDLVKKIESSTPATVLIWIGSNFGGCDLPNTKGLGIDLVVSFGHNQFFKEGEGW